ncbi:uncharacterized protein [Magallana gigas]|uniref:uncharacterized protein n=1 Tax=Magallana gigas TaxID=29159 RepID=UPI00333EEF82
MATLKTITLVVVLFHIDVNVYGLSSDESCRERLDNHEILLAKLNEKLENHQADSTKDEAIFKVIQDENSYLKRRLKSLEEIVLTSTYRTEKLEARIADLESSNWFLKSRLTTANNNYSFDENYLSSLFWNLKASDSRKESTTTKTSTTHGNEMKTRLQTSMVKRKIRQLEKKPSVSQEKRLLTGIQSTRTPFPDGVAFSAYMYVHTTEISKGSTIHFDTIVTNIGNHYNKHSGIFTAPQHGVYVFTWNLYCDGYIYSQLVVNSNVVGAMFSSAEGASNIRTPTGIVVVEVNQGDIAYVRIHPTGNHSGNLNSHPNWRSSFNGWKLY